MRSLRTMFLVALAWATLGAGTLAAVMVAGVITAPTAKVMYQGTRPQIVVEWVDTNTTVVRTEIQRRSTSPDTVWRRVGYNLGNKLKLFYDPYVLINKKYIYRMRDSVAGAVLTAFSDTAFATTTKLP